MQMTVGEYVSRVSAALERVDLEEICKAIDIIRSAWERGSQIIVLGNGGSAMAALHFITDWNKNIPLATGRPFYGRTLVDNIGLFSAWGNDTSYDDVFAEQLKTIMKPGDLVLAISGSGNSENVIRAVQWAKANGGETLALCGYNGGRLRQEAGYSVWIRENDMQLVEDLHCVFGHMVLRVLGDYKSSHACS